MRQLSQDIWTRPVGNVLPKPLTMTMFQMISNVYDLGNSELQIKRA